MAVKYQKFVESISAVTGLDTAEARAMAEAALGTLARQVSRANRRRLLQALPGDLRAGIPDAGGLVHIDDVSFISAVSQLSGRTEEECWLLTNAVFAALAEQEPELVQRLDVPGRIRDLFNPPHPGGGITGPHGNQAPLTDEEVREALSQLPYWSGDTSALVRTVELPEENLDRVVERIQNLRRELGRGPTVRRMDGVADLVVNTATVDAVTALDIDLAHEIDRTIDEAGAGIWSG